MSFISNFLIKQNITSIVFFGFCVRILTLIFYGSPKFGDSQTYERIGREIFNGSLVATNIHMPGYGVWMFISNSISQNYYGVIITDILISSATIYLIYLLSKEIFPPCERIMSLAIDRPKPTPDLFCPLLLSIL